MVASPPARAIEGAQLPKWLRATSLAWAGALLACVIVVITAAFLHHEERALETNELQSAALYARVLQDHAERTFDTIDIAIGSVADKVDAALRTQDTGRVDQDLAQALRGLPFLRSLSLMTAEGRVVASSSPGNVGVVVDLARIRLPAAGAPEFLGSSIPGRDLQDARRGPAAEASASTTFVPLVHALPESSGRERLFVVAVLNPDFFANAYEPTLADDTRRAGIFSIRAELFAATGNIRKAPGRMATDHRFFSQFLPARESGSFIGPGIDGTEAITAFRALRKRPLVVIVERDFERVLVGFRQTAWWALGLCTGALLTIAAVMVMGYRSLRSHEAVSAALEGTREEIAASERDLRVLVESVHELIFRADASGRIVFVNGRWQGLTQRPAAEILGKRLPELCRPDERQACDEVFTRLGAQDQTLLVHVQDAAGRFLALDLSASRVVGAGGELTGFAGFAVDVTERELAQQALQSQLQFTAQLLDITPIPVFVKDELGRFANVNRAWLALMNLELPEVLGRNSEELFGPEAPSHTAQDARLLASQERISYESLLVVAGRPSRDTVVTKVRFTRADGTAAGIVGSIVDVTEFREAERSIRKARDAAQSANRAKSEFIANISHELRTPLQGIIGFSELGRDLAGRMPDLLDMFDEIHAGGRRMLTLVNGLLDVSQMDSSFGPRSLRRVDIARVVRETVGQLQPEAAVRGLTLTLLGLDDRVEGDVDKDRFQQAVRNVLANAIRYSPEGGRIEVALVDRAGAGLELSVRDHGPGFPEEELELVFEAFMQSSRTRDGSGGAGLGLTIARKVMTAHGGQATAANAEGGGARVSLTLPPASGASAAPEDLAWQDPHGLLSESEAI